jgi:hypothetical protein
MITINLDKAKVITKDRLRAERTPLLEALDIETMRNLSNADKLAIIDAQKQVLRDVTAKVDTLTSLEELKGLSCQ